MRISTTTGGLSETHGYDTALKMIADAGFDCADLNLCDMATNKDCPFLKNDYADFAHKIKASAEKYGICFNQAHAPYQMNMFKYVEGEEESEKIINLLIRSIEISGIVGAENVVVHPVQCFCYHDTDPEEQLKINVEFYKKLIPAAKKAGVKIAIENMWRRNQYVQNQISCSVCSSPYELAKYIDECNKIENCFVACLDIGHCSLTGHSPANAIRVLGDRLKALHTHDTDFVHDSHTCPLTMSIPYYEVMAALKEINYKGDITLEAHHFFDKFDESFHHEALLFMAKVTRHLSTFAE